MNLAELIEKLQEIAAKISLDDEDSPNDYDVYFQHGARTYLVTGIAYDHVEDIDITLTGKWSNPQ